MIMLKRSLSISLLLLMDLVFAQPVSIDGLNINRAPEKYSAPQKVYDGSDSSDSLAVVKPEFTINLPGGKYGAMQSDAASASDSSGNTAVVWIDYRYGVKYVYAQVYDVSGNKTGNNFRLSDSRVYESYPFVTANKKGDFIVVWMQDYQTIMAQRFNSSGIKTGNNFLVYRSPGTAVYCPSAAMNEDGTFLIMWTEYSNNNNVFVKYFRADNSYNPEIPINDADKPASTIAQGRQIAIDGMGNYVVVWSSKGIGSQSDIYLQMFDNYGNKTGANRLVSDPGIARNKYYPKVAATDDGQFLIAWSMQQDWGYAFCGGGRIFSSDGSFTGSQLELHSSVGPANLSISSDRKSTFLVQYYEGKAEMITSDGRIKGVVSWIRFGNGDPYSNYEPAVSDFCNGIFYSCIFIWNRSDGDIYTRRFNTRFDPAGDFIKVNDDSISSSQSKPTVYSNKNGYSIVLWEDNRNGDFDLYARVYDPEFNPVGEELQVNDSIYGSWFLDYKNVCSFSDGTFLVVFSGPGNNGNRVVFGQKITTDGKLYGNNKYLREDVKPLNLALNTNSSDEVLVCFFNESTVFARKFNHDLDPLQNTVTLSKDYTRYTYSIYVDTVLNVFSVWSDGSFIRGVIFNSTGRVISDNIKFIYNSGPPQYIDCVTDGLDYAIVCGGYTLSMYRGYVLDNSYVTYSKSIYNTHYVNPDILKFENKKLFFISSNQYKINGYYLNDLREESKQLVIHNFEDLWNDNIRNTGASLINNRIFITYDDLNGERGLDITGIVYFSDSLDFKDENHLWVRNDDYLFNNFPNPFNGSTVIPYKLLSPGHVKLTIYDILGREVKVLVDDFREKGLYEERFDASGLASGVYIYKLDAFKTYTKKFIIMK